MLLDVIEALCGVAPAGWEFVPYLLSTGVTVWFIAMLVSLMGVFTSLKR